MSAGIQVATAEDVDDCLTNGLDLNVIWIGLATLHETPTGGLVPLPDFLK